MNALLQPTMPRVAELHQRALFANLPDPIRERFHHSAVVNGWVRAFLGGYITRDHLMEGLACGLAMQNELMSHNIAAYAARFGHLEHSQPTRKCRVCGCTDADCSVCIERTGHPCHWVAPDLCSACVAGLG